MPGARGRLPARRSGSRQARPRMPVWAGAGRARAEARRRSSSCRRAASRSAAAAPRRALPAPAPRSARPAARRALVHARGEAARGHGVRQVRRGLPQRLIDSKAAAHLPELWRPASCRPRRASARRAQEWGTGCDERPRQRARTVATRGRAGAAGTWLRSRRASSSSCSFACAASLSAASSYGEQARGAGAFGAGLVPATTDEGVRGTRGQGSSKKGGHLAAAQLAGELLLLLRLRRLALGLRLRHQRAAALVDAAQLLAHRAVAHEPRLALRGRLCLGTLQPR